MAINLKAPDFTELKPRILVFGVGGAGGNAVNNMVASKLEGVEFIVANTDAQALAHSKAQRRIQIGNKLTSGLGAGSRPEVGSAAAEESTQELKDCLNGSHMAFITAGMGGGTGTGAAPVIARIAREMGVLTVGVVTKPFAFEGQRRMRLAEEGIQKMQEFVDTLIVIPNQNLFRVANEKTTFAKAFEIADDVLYSGVRGITDLMVMPGLINLDFADVRTVMSEMGTAMMGTGEASGERRAIEAAEAAISNPLLDHSSMKGARGVLINITGGMDLTLFEVDEAANKIRAEVDPEANIIVGSTFDEKLDGVMRVSVVATGIAREVKAQPSPMKSATLEATRIIRPSVAVSASETKIEIRRTPEPQITPPASNPVHALQTEILQAGLAAEQERAAAQTSSRPAAMADEQIARQPLPAIPSSAPRAQPASDSLTFDPTIIGSLGPDPREATRQRIAAQIRPGTRPEGERERPAPKKSGFSILGINIGGSGSQPKKSSGRGQAPSTSMRLPPEQHLLPEDSEVRVVPQAGRSKSAQTRNEATEESMASRSAADDQLEIPAFLRRQAN